MTAWLWHLWGNIALICAAVFGLYVLAQLAGWARRDWRGFTAVLCGELALLCGILAVLWAVVVGEGRGYF